MEYYAGSEGNGVTVSTSQDWLTHRGTVGRAVVGNVKILDENDQELPVGEIGAVYAARLGPCTPPCAIQRDKLPRNSRMDSLALVGVIKHV